MLRSDGGEEVMAVKSSDTEDMDSWFDEKRSRTRQGFIWLVP